MTFLQMIWYSDPVLNLQWRLNDLRLACSPRRRLEDLAWWVAFRLPRRVVEFCAIRVMAHATCGKWSGQEVPALTCADALKRWEQE